MTAEINFDGIVGPTHNYGGLSRGNIASETHGGWKSHPREAALQGLEKMKRLSGMGVLQAVLPPHERPDVSVLLKVGFRGSEADILERVGRENPLLLRACSSASPMWAANAGTTTPSSDSGDGKVHFTPANLTHTFHRSLEASTTAAVLRVIFCNGRFFSHHDPLPLGRFFSDEGAANQSRLCSAYGKKGLHLFVYGFSVRDAVAPLPERFSPRQSREASEAVARLNRLAPEDAVFARQSARAIQSGAFHNDVVLVGDRNFLFFHEEAFSDSELVVEQLRGRYLQVNAQELNIFSVPASRVTLAEAVRTYLFNSQLVALPDGGRLLVAPEECREASPIKSLLDELPERTGGAVSGVSFSNLRESMWNGGGPACLRLRVVLTDAERASLGGRVLLTESLHGELVTWVNKHYRESLVPEELSEPGLLEESRRALDELTGILGLGSVYRFQQVMPGVPPWEQEP